MHVRTLAPIVAFGGSALIVAAAVAIMARQGSPESDAVAGFEMSTGVDMTTGATVKPSANPSTASVTRAAPSITGEAPLPTEEQGLPGR